MIGCRKGMDYFYDDHFTINHAIDLQVDILTELGLDVGFFPPLSLVNCNRLVLSMISDRDIGDDLQKGVNLNGVTDRGPPFFTPIIWNALLHVINWEKERQILETLLAYPIDCNYIGMCGVNLLHIYIIQSLMSEEGFQKLKWWVQHPMVDVNARCLVVGNRPLIKVLHPMELIGVLTSRWTKSSTRKHAEKVVAFLLSRGMSREYTSPLWSKLCSVRGDELLYKKGKKSQSERFFMERMRSQWGAMDDRDLSRRISKKQTINDSTNFDYQLTPTPQMNNLKDIPREHHLHYRSSSGVKIGFHSSYLDVITKTHVFPFTAEQLTNMEIMPWMTYVRTKFVPREEFVFSEVRDSFPSFLSDEKYLYEDQIKHGLQMLCHWIVSIYPYSRFMMLLGFKHPPHKLYSYFFTEMRNGPCFLQPFHLHTTTTDWVECFFWACYDSVREGFPFPNQLEELISRLEIYENIQLTFNRSFPTLRSFLQVYGHGPNLFRIFADEYDYSLLQVYYIFRKLSDHFDG